VAGGAEGVVAAVGLVSGILTTPESESRVPFVVPQHEKADQPLVFLINKVIGKRFEGCAPQPIRDEMKCPGILKDLRCGNLGISKETITQFGATFRVIEGQRGTKIRFESGDGR
jgi:hypothetical protein